MNCPNCGNPEMKQIPAGTSKKTGKPYSAFYKCEACGKTANAGADTAPRQVVKEDNYNGTVGMAKAMTALYAACYQHGDDVVVAAEKVRKAIKDIYSVQQDGIEEEVPF